MNRLCLPVLFCLTGVYASAQTYSTITISSSAPGARFSVDGQPYMSAANFNWPLGSSHVLAFITDPLLPNQSASAVQTSTDGSTQFLFNGWKDNTGFLVPTAAPIQTITANPAITSITAQVTVAYRVMLNFFNSPNPLVDGISPPTCGAPSSASQVPAGEVRAGEVFVGTACFWNSANIFAQANTLLNLNAFPYPGFVFLGWSINGGIVSPFLSSLTLTGPVTLVPMFTPAKRVHFLTNPAGLQVQVDHTPTVTLTAPEVNGLCPANQSQPVSPITGFPALCFGDYDFGPGTAHVVAGVTPQRDVNGNWWVFSSWSSNVSATGVYTADSTVGNSDTVTATYVPGAQISFLTSPTGLKLTVDNRQNWPGYNFVWGLGTTHTVTASPTQASSNGRQYSFQGWSNSGAATQTISVDQNAVANGLRMTANYAILNRIVIQSSAPSLSVMVDGTNCQLPCTIDRPSGSQVHVTAQPQISMGAGSRLDFSSWSDGGAPDHVINVNQDSTTLNLNYTTSYQLLLASAPAAGASFQLNPASPDGFYPQGTQVTVTAVPNPGFKFLRWAGDLSGGFPSGVITMAVPHNVQAQLNAVPFIPTAGITNAVGATPNSAVAPGSIISIYGQGLAPNLEVGPVNPLSQALSGVTVTINDQILGLLFVSAGQINAQVPSTLADGTYTLVVHNSGQADVSTTFTVARDAPGLFAQTINSQQYVLAMHADGSLVTPDSPAAGGETISVLGTGFGPYNGTIVDGFFPPTPAPTLVDPVVVTAGGIDPVATWAGAAPGYAGVVLTQFQVPAGMPSGTSVPMKVTVNGTDSNTLLLPLQ